MRGFGVATGSVAEFFGRHLVRRVFVWPHLSDRRLAVDLFANSGSALWPASVHRSGVKPRPEKNLSPKSRKIFGLEV